MRTFFTPLKTFFLFVSLLLFGTHVQAQYTEAEVEHNSTDRYTGVTRDDQGNIYVVRPDAAGTHYEVAKYTNGTGTATIIYGGLSFDPGLAKDYPYGITVDPSGNVYVVSAFGSTNGTVYKLTAPSYSASTFTSGNFYTAITHDATGNIYTMEYDAGADAYGVARYTPGGARTPLWFGIPITPNGNSIASNPWGIVVDASNNIYFTTFLESTGSYDDGGDILRLVPPYSAAPTKLRQGNGYTALAMDNAGAFYTLEYDADLVHGDVRKYTNLATAGTVLYNALSLNTSDPYGHPLGLAVRDNGEIYTADFPSSGVGYLHRLTPPSTTVSSINRVNTSPTNATSLAYTVTFAGAVSGLTASNFTATPVSGSLTSTGITVTQVTSSTYTVTINGVAGNGTMRLDMANATGVSPTVTNAPFTTGQTYVVDQTVPVVTLQINSGATYTTTTGVTLSETATDNDPSLQMRFSNDNSNWTAYEAFSATKAYTLPAGDGVKTVYIQVKDNAGNVGTANATITLDQTAPITTIGTTPPNPSNSSTATFTFTANEAVSAFQASVDGGPSNPVTSPLTLTGLGGGPHFISVRAKDLAGNVGNSATYNWTIDLTPPTITNLTIPDGTYHIGQTVTLTATMSENVINDGAGGANVPWIDVQVGSTTQKFQYTGGSGSASLTFTYVVQEGDLDMDGVTVSPTLNLNGNNITDAAGNAVNTTATAVGNTTAVLINGIRPTITWSAPTTSNQSPLILTATFSEQVTGVSAASIQLSGIAGASVSAVTPSVVTPTTAYTININVPANSSGTLHVNMLANQATGVTSGNTNAASAVDIDYSNIAPVVTQVKVPTNGYYKAGQALNFLVDFDKNITVNTGAGSLSLPVTIGSTTVQATYVGGTGTSELQFRYTVQAGDNDNDGIQLASSLTTATGSLLDSYGNNATPTLNNVAVTTGVLVNTVIPTVTLSTAAVSPLNGTFQVTATFSEVVSNFSTAGFSVTNASVSNLQTADNITYTADVAPAADGAVSVTVSADAAQNVGGNGNTASNTINETADFTAPVVTSVSIPADSIYNETNVLTFQVFFSENVNVNTAGGTPYVAVNMTSGTAPATYVSGTGTNTLTFQYTVQAGDNAHTGISMGAGISLGGGATIMDAAGNNAILVLNSVPATSGVIVNTDAPTVTLSTTAVSPINAGFQVTATFSEAVTGLSLADFTVTNGTASNLQTTDNITYTFTVTPTADGTVSVTLPANSAASAARNGNVVSNTLSITADVTPPSVAMDTPPANGWYKAGQVLTFTAQFGENVVVTGTPQIGITLTTGTVFAGYVSGSGTNTLTFSYTVQTGDVDKDGITAATAITLNSGSIKDAAGNNAVLTLPAMTTTGVLVDAVAPVVSTVSVPANGTYKATQALSFTVHFSENVTITGTPQLPITIGASTVNATYASGTGTQDIVFTYTIAAGDNDNNGIALGTTIDLNGGTIKDAAGNDATLTLNGVPSTTGILVDTDAPGVTLTPAPTTPVNHNITLTATFTESVTGLSTAGITVTNGTATVTGSGTTWTITVTPTADGNVAVTVNAGAAQDAAGNDNTVSNTLTYVYDHTAPNAPVITGVTGSNPSHTAANTLTGTAENNATVNVSQDGTVIGTTTASGTGAWSYNVASLTDGSYNFTATATDAAGNTGTVSNTYNLVVDLTAPVVSSVDVISDGIYKVGDVLTFTVHFSENVNITGTPQLPVTIGSTVVNAAYVSGTGTPDIEFAYTVVTGDNDHDGIALGTALNLNGGGIKDAAGNDAALALHSVPSTTGVLVDTDIPSVTLTPPATVPVNHAIVLTATFSEAVVGLDATGLTVTNGTATVTGSGTTWTITVTPTADGNVSTTVNAAAVQDPAGNDNTASNTLTYVYDHTAPPAPVISGVTGANPSNVPTNTLHGTAEPNATVSIIEDGTPQTTVPADGAGNWAYTTGSLVSGTYNFTATATDVAGNTSPVSNTYSLVVDYVTPTVMNVVVPADGSYKAGTTLTFIVSFNKAMTVTGTPQLPITIGSTNVNADYVSGSGTMYLTFQYTVLAGQNDNDGIAVGSALVLNGGTIKDAATNVADLTLHMVDPTNNVLVDTQAPDVVLTPNATVPVNTNINININFTEPVTGFTAGDITVTNGSVLSVSGSGSAYTAIIAPTADGSVTMTVNAGVAQDAAGNDNNASNQLVYTYDHTAPAAPVISGVSGANPSNTALNTLQGTAEANSTVNITQDGVAAGTAPVNGSGNWSFNTAALLDGDHVFTATATDAAGNTGAVSNTYHLVVDLSAPVVSSVAVPAVGSYKAGTTLTFTVRFSEDVTVTGTPQLPITIGASTVNAAYVSGSGSPDLVFTYTVAAGDNDNDGITIGALALNGGSIKDAAGNIANLTLNNAGSTTHVLVDTQAPDVTLTTTATSPINHAFTVTVTFTEPVDALNLDLHNATAGTINTTDNKTFTVVINPTADGTVTVQVDAGASQDAAGNPNTASNILTLTYDGTAPTITTVSVPAAKTYVAAENLDFTVTFDGNVTITGTPTLDIVVGSSTKQAALLSSTATTATFRYTVQPGDADADGISLPAALALNGGSITDAAGNNADLTLHGAGATTGVKVDAVPPVIVAAQAFTAITESPVGTVIGTLAGNDPGGNGTLQQWTLTGDDAAGAGLAAFQLDATTGVLSVKNSTTVDAHVNETITLQVTVSDGYNTSAVQTVTVHIRPKFLVPTDITLSNNTVNDRSPLHTTVGDLTTVTAQPGVTFTYTFAGGADDAAFTIAGGQLQTNAAVDYATKPVYHIRIRSTDNNAQFVEKDFTINVNFVNLPPVINTIPDQAVCATITPQTVAVTGISAVEAGQTYTLAVSANRDYFDALTITDDGGGKATIHYTEKADVSGSVQITVLVKDNGGTANGGNDTRSTSFAVNIAAPPILTITSDVGLSISKGDYVHLEANADQATSFNWVGTADIISGQQTSTIYVRPLSDATYTVTVTNAQGCSNSASVNLQVSAEAKQNAANILTPNGDGQNDHWIIKNIDLFPNNEVKIFDRSGRLVYDKKSYTNDWMGTVNGQPLAEGTYYYIIDYGNGQPPAKGYITIVRDKY